MKIFAITIIAVLVVWSMLRPAEVNEADSHILEDAD